MGKLREYKCIILIALLILGFIFYWFQLRPSKIKEACYAEAEFDSRATSESNDVKRQEFINNYYNDCLKRLGVR